MARNHARYQSSFLANNMFFGLVLAHLNAQNIHGVTTELLHIKFDQMRNLKIYLAFRLAYISYPVIYVSVTPKVLTYQLVTTRLPISSLIFSA